MFVHMNMYPYIHIVLYTYICIYFYRGIDEYKENNLQCALTYVSNTEDQTQTMLILTEGLENGKGSTGGAIDHGLSGGRYRCTSYIYVYIHIYLCHWRESLALLNTWMGYICMHIHLFMYI
jgi:hypothetical protein